MTWQAANACSADAQSNTNFAGSICRGFVAVDLHWDWAAGLNSGCYLVLDCLVCSVLLMLQNGFGCQAAPVNACEAFVVALQSHHRL
jgi:hypothetical protein